MQPTDPAKVSVAIPTYNGARHLSEALQSILAQGDSYPIFVSDDRSDDGTLEIVQAVAGDRVRSFINTERLGLAGNWNRCAELTSSPFVAIVHQDDFLRPGHIASHAAAISRDPRVGLIASASRTIDDSGREVPAAVVDRGGLGSHDLMLGAGDALRALATANPFRCSGVTINVAAHAELGGFDPAWRYLVDWDYWLRVARNYRVAWLAEPTVDVRWHAASETHRFARGTIDLEETTRLLDKLYAAESSRWPDAADLRRRADHRLARAYLNRAHVALRAGDGDLARRALRRSLAMKPTLLGPILLDPRLAVQVAAIAVAPRWAARVFKRP